MVSKLIALSFLILSTYSIVTLNGITIDARISGNDIKLYITGNSGFLAFGFGKSMAKAEIFLLENAKGTFSFKTCKLTGRQSPTCGLGYWTSSNFTYNLSNGTWSLVAIRNLLLASDLTLSNASNSMLYSYSSNNVLDYGHPSGNSHGVINVYLTPEVIAQNTTSIPPSSNQTTTIPTTITPTNNQNETSKGDTETENETITVISSGNGTAVPVSPPDSNETNSDSTNPIPVNNTTSSSTEKTDDYKKNNNTISSNTTQTGSNTSTTPTNNVPALGSNITTTITVIPFNQNGSAKLGIGFQFIWLILVILTLFKRW